MPVGRKQCRMDRRRNTVVNFVVNFLLGYAVAALLRGRRAGIRVGLFAGTIGAVISWIGYERPELFNSMGDDDAEPIEIEV